MLLAAFALRAPQANGAPEEDSRKYTVMAAFLYNFLVFVEWPDVASFGQGPVLIGVLGDNPFGAAVEAITRKTIDDRPIEFRFFPDIHAVTPTHILFVPVDCNEELDALCGTLRGKPVLTVGESDDFTRRGGVIRFFEAEAGAGKTLRVEINEAAAEAQGLKIRAKLMRLASVVHYPAPAHADQGGPRTAPP